MYTIGPINYIPPQYYIGNPLFPPPSRTCVLGATELLRRSFPPLNIICLPGVLPTKRASRTTAPIWGLTKTRIPKTRDWDIFLERLCLSWCPLCCGVVSASLDKQVCFAPLRILAEASGPLLSMDDGEPSAPKRL